MIYNKLSEFWLNWQINQPNLFQALI